MKILHIADVHLGVKFLNKNPKIREELMKSQIDMLKDIVDYCINEEIKILMIAGDLFDSENIPLKIEKNVIDQFNRLNTKEIKVFYATGNHDPRSDFKKLYDLFPENVYVISEKTYEKHVIDNKVQIISCGHETSNEQRDLVKDFPVKRDPIFTIGLVHCNLEGYESEEGKYLPTSKAVLKSKKYDYWAIGHIHKKAEEDNIYYPGSPQGINYKETQIKGGNLIEIIDEKSCKVNFVEFSKVYWKSIDILINEDINDKYQLVDRIEEKINKEFKFNKKFLLKINLSGASKLFLKLQDEDFLNEIKDSLIDKFYNLIDLKFKNENIKPYIEYEDYISDKNILGYINKRFSDEEMKDQLIKKLMDNKYIGEHLHDNEERYEYIKRILEEVKEETFLRMVGIHYED